MSYREDWKNTMDEAAKLSWKEKVQYALKLIKTVANIGMENPAESKRRFHNICQIIEYFNHIPDDELETEIFLFIQNNSKVTTERIVDTFSFVEENRIQRILNCLIKTKKVATITEKYYLA